MTAFDDAVPEVPEEWTEQAVGASLAAAMRPEWRYVPELRTWLHWDGRRWQEAVDDRAQAWAQAWAERIGRRVVSGDPDVVKRYLRFRQVGPLERAVASARRRLLVRVGQLDAHPLLLNVGNGVVDLRTGELGAHDPDLLLTKVAGADYRPGAQHVDVTAALRAMAPQVEASMQMHLGAAATGLATVELAVLDGAGANGKTTVLVAWAAALGDYAGPISSALVMQTANDNPAVWAAELRGLRLAYLEETQEDGGFRLERLKALTGGAPIVAARKYGQPFTFDPSHTLLLATNHRPVVNTAEHATWRRLRLVPFPHRYVVPGDGSTPQPGDRCGDAGLKTRIVGRAQREAMLAWIVDGAVYALEAGGDVPFVDWATDIVDATSEWAGDEDVIHRFIEDCYELTGDDIDRVRIAEVFKQYQSWCQHSENRRAGSAKLFHQRFADHAEVRAARVERQVRDSGQRVYVGLRLLPTAPWSPL